MEISKGHVAERVRHYLKNAHPSGATLEVMEDEIWIQDSVWQVLIQPDVEPKKISEYYELLADVMIELQDAEGLDVHLHPVDARSEMRLRAA